MNDEYGHFSTDGREFVITRRDLPFPWLNYLTNGDWLALTSFQGGGLSSYLEQRFNSVTRRHLDMPRSDLPGRLLFLRDRDSGERWTATGHPSFGEPEAFRSIIGLGTTRVMTTHHGVEHEVFFFVPKNPSSDRQGEQDPCEIWRLTLTNRSPRRRRLRVTTYSEWVMGDVHQDMADAPFFKLFRRARYDDGVIYARNDRWGAPGHETEPWPNEVFFTATREPTAWDLSVASFVGLGRTVADPIGVETGRMACQREFSGDDVCGALAFDFDLEPGEQASLDVILGLVPDDAPRFRDLPDKYRDPEAVEAALDETRRWWAAFVDTLVVDTPDADLDRTINVWNKYQIFMTLSFGHGPSYFHGNQHATMRDSMQDSFGLIPLRPDRARETILRAMSFQYADGSPSYASNRMGLPEAKWDKVDLPVWLTLTLDNYLAETGDWALLDEVVPFYDEGEGSLFEHLRRGLERVSTDSGERGLPLIGRGDWNDALDGVGAAGRGESVWLAQFLAMAFRMASTIAERHGERELGRRWAARSEALARRINDVAWDGDWYLRAFDDDGAPVGSASNEHGKIYLNTQTWAVLSGTAPPDRARRCLESALEHLRSRSGMALFAPAYPAFDPKVGIISQFPKGVKENAACFTHAGAFHLVALLAAGMAEEAYSLFRDMLPPLQPQPRYRMEPYTYSQYVAGPESDRFGQGAFHWMTGSASWMFRAVLDWMLGVRPELDGLRLAPCIPSTWPGYSVQRPWRGAHLRIIVENPDGLCRGLRSLTVDGEPRDPDALLPPFEPGTSPEIVATMGTRERSDDGEP